MTAPLDSDLDFVAPASSTAARLICSELPDVIPTHVVVCLGDPVEQSAASLVWAYSSSSRSLEDSTQEVGWLVVLGEDVPHGPTN